MDGMTKWGAINPFTPKTSIRLDKLNSKQFFALGLNQKYKAKGADSWKIWT